ncbi:uncharacterized protein A1O5_06684 [Cladophialophora psammophila CBS 110553]|uniref:Single-strand DNA deaminase toxin A-like C-terminal domain-containing protein n=1 Tax=Cladophialophora psammophila CBS 110553 TaxID=1182543 RepID=W9WRQ1_9EURO|nr:uncharacterized protein A1O5_06684 [Cladophialophora psammophila CBS 110553]EXJ70613.1 hypothetical protein A1O5_06684 [Cladophialophora psammophila CBS 110553]
MSGWSHAPKVTFGSGRSWASEVMRIEKIVGHPLMSHPKDQGTRGKYYACHAEKKLMAYFISQHVFLKDEVSAPSDAGSEMALTYEDRGSRIEDRGSRIGERTGGVEGSTREI